MLQSVLITMRSLLSNLCCGTEFTVTGISDQSNSLVARRPHLTSSIASTFDADNRYLASVMVWPTEEKSRSVYQLADILRRRRATCDRTGYSFVCSLCSTAVDFYLQLEHAVPCIGPAPQ